MSKTEPAPLRSWKLRPECELPEQDAVLERLGRETGLSKVTLRVCLSRGLKDAASIQDFVSPKLELLKDPSCILDMDRGVERLCQARASSELVWVFGDYDVDGTTGAALLSWILRDFGYQHQVRQPDRFKDGYGLNVKAVEEAHQAGAQVLVTVDCGITSFEAASRAKELGIDLIIVDHHQVDVVKGLPIAFAVINPQRADCTSELKQLCGCGLAFYLARALRTAGKKLGWWENGKEPNLKQHLDLVVMATAADMVPLLGDNHIMVRHGLQILKQTKKPGVRALLEQAGLGSKDVSPGHLGFVLGPRINASGRMASASLALELLTTQDQGRAATLAHELEKMNQERAEIQNRIWDQVRTRVEEGLAQGKFKHGILVADAAWHEGVVGIVASRVTETFRKPAAVIALREDFGKGSVRSYGGKDVLGALRASKEHLLGFGGHKHAAGLSVGLENIEALALSFDEALGAMVQDEDLLPLYIEGKCSLDELDVRTLQELEGLGPFGPGNPEPVFTIRAAATRTQILKGRHFKLNLENVENIQKNRGRIEAIWFHAAERVELSGSSVLEEIAEWAGVPELNRFRGSITPTFRIKDRRALSH